MAGLAGGVIEGCEDVFTASAGCAVCELSGGLEEGFGGCGFELLDEAVLIPILPGFDEAAVFEAEDADAGHG